MGLRLPKISATNALLVLGFSGLVSFILYLQFITKRAFLLDLYTVATNFGTIIRAKKDIAFATYGIFLLLFLLYMLAWWAAGQVKSRDAWTIVIGWGVLLCVPMFLLHPYDARDIFDNILRARILGVYGQNPYLQTASAFPNDPFYNFAWWKGFASPYGPFWEQIASLGARIAGDGILANIIIFKIISILFLFLTTIFIYLTLKNHAPERALQGTLLFMWNPLVLFEVVGNAHNDISMLLWVAASIWASASKRWTLAVWFLAVGVVFKFIPILLLPTAGLIGLANQVDRRSKWKYFFGTGLGCLAIWFVAYLPFWYGFGTLTFMKQGSLLTTSLASLVYYNFQSVLGRFGRQIISNTSIILTVVFSFWMAFRSLRKPVWENYARTATIVLLFYILITCTWYQNWYLLWPLTTAVFLPGSSLMLAAVLFSVTGLVKPFVAMPLFSWLAKPGPPIVQETNITLVTQTFPWGVSLFLWIKSLLKNKHTKKESSFPVRPCQFDDLPAVLNLITQLAEVSGNTKEFQLAQMERVFNKMQSWPEIYSNYVYISDGKVTGFISIVFYRTFFHRVGTAQVNELVIDQAYRGKGIGHALMKTAEDEARLRGMDELEVGTESTNVAAQKFYRKYGFDEEYVLFGMEFTKEPDYPPDSGGKNPNSSPS
jgi:ribosomal protein S18 acetylase RimI-like enzyme